MVAPRDLQVSALPVPGLHGFWALNFGPHICMANTSPPLSFLLSLREKVWNQDGIVDLRVLKEAPGCDQCRGGDCHGDEWGHCHGDEKRQMLFTTARQDGRLAKREDAQLGLRFVFLWCENELTFFEIVFLSLAFSLSLTF